MSLAAAAPGLAQQAPQPRPQRPPAQPAQPAQPQPQAQPQQAQGAPAMVVQVKAEPSQADWTKMCGKDQAQNAEVCFTTRDFVSDQGQPVLAVAVYDIKGAQPQKVVRFLVPPGLLLQPGVRFAVDQGQPTAGRYTVCLPNGCFAEATGLKDDIVNQFKKGTTLNLSAQNPTMREVTFAVPLAGFGKAFDGPPADPKVIEEQQKKLQEEMQKRSDEMRQRLQQSGGAPGTAPPTTGAAAVPPPAGAAPRR
jgi:invasion protein IalB